MAALPSSPPRRIHSRRSSHSSNNSSQYSFDLDALLPPEDDDSSALAIPPQNKHAIDVVHSEDIDGPTDFTQNMEYWMSAKLPTVVTPTKMEGAIKKDMEEYISNDDPKSTTRHDDQQVEEGADQHLPHQRAMSPDHVDPDESMERPSTPDGSNNGGMSFLSNIPHGDESTPRTVEPASPLSRPTSRQATVEDYDDTPIRPRDLLSASSSAIGATLRSPELTFRGKPAPGPAEEAPAAPSETERSLEMALNQLRKELAEVRAQTQEQLRRQSQDHEARITKERNASAEASKQVADSWQAKLKESKTSYEAKLASWQARTDDASIDQAQQLDELERRLKHYEIETEKRDKHISEQAWNITDQDQKLQDAQKEIVTLGRELETMTEKYRVAHEDLEDEQREHGSRYHTLQNDYEHLEARQKDADDRIKALEAELSRVRTEERLEADLRMQPLQTKYQQLQSDGLLIGEQIQDLSSQMSRTVNEHIKELERTEANAEEAITKARESFAIEKKRLEDGLEAARAGNHMLRSEAAEKDTELNRLRDRAHDDTLDRAQITTLAQERDLLITKFKEQKTKYTKSLTESQNTIKTLQTRIKDQEFALSTAKKDLQSSQTALSKARENVKSAREDAAKAQAEIQQLKEDTEAVNAAFDLRVKEMMRSRETEWTKRYEALRKEKGIMGKVLMKEWGEKEVGLGVPQGYRYKLT